MEDDEVITISAEDVKIFLDEDDMHQYLQENGFKEVKVEDK